MGGVEAQWWTETPPVLLAAPMREPGGVGGASITTYPTVSLSVGTKATTYDDHQGLLAVPSTGELEGDANHCHVSSAVSVSTVWVDYSRTKQRAARP